MTLQGCNGKGERPELRLNSTPLKRRVAEVFSGVGKLVEKYMTLGASHRPAVFANWLFIQRKNKLLASLWQDVVLPFVARCSPKLSTCPPTETRKKSSEVFSKVIVSFYISTTHESHSCSTSSPTPSIVSPLDFGIFCGCIMFLIVG